MGLSTWDIIFIIIKIGDRHEIEFEGRKSWDNEYWREY